MRRKRWKGIATNVVGEAGAGMNTDQTRDEIWESASGPDESWPVGCKIIQIVGAESTVKVSQDVVIYKNYLEGLLMQILRLHP